MGEGGCSGGIDIRTLQSGRGRRIGMAFHLLSGAAAAAAAAHPPPLRLVRGVRRVQRETLHARIEFRPTRAVRRCKFPHTGGAPMVRESGPGGGNKGETVTAGIVDGRARESARGRGVGKSGH